MESTPDRIGREEYDRGYQDAQAEFELTARQNGRELQQPFQTFWWQREAWDNEELKSGRSKERNSYFQLHARSEHKLFSQLRESFKKQEKRFLKHFDEQSQKLNSWLLGKASAEDYLLDKKEEVGIFEDEFDNLFSDMFERGANAAIAQNLFNIKFDIDNSEAVEFLENKLFKFSDAVNETTIQNLRTTLSYGLSNGDTLEELRKRIQVVFNGTIRGTASRSRKIARTETNCLLNGGQHNAYIQSDVVQSIIWLSASDERTRSSHTAVNRKEVRLREPFTVGGYNMYFPGDSSLGAPAKEIINCRCTTIVGELTA